MSTRPLTAPAPSRRRCGSRGCPVEGRRSPSSSSPTSSTRSPADCTIGDLGDATANAHWIVDLENTLGVGVESAVQNALTGTVVLWILNHLYLAAQLVVLPGALWLLHRKARAAYDAPAQHGARHLAAVDPGLRAVPRRPAAAGRHRHGRHDLQPDRLRDGLEA